MKKISTRFALLLAAAAVLPLLGYGAVSIYSLRTGARQAVVQGNLNVARRAAEQIELYITGSVKILKALAADLQQTGLEPWQQDRILKNFVLEFPEYRELTLLDDTGRPRVSSALGVPSVGVPGSEGVNIEGALMSRFSCTAKAFTMAARNSIMAPWRTRSASMFAVCNSASALSMRAAPLLKMGSSTLALNTAV